MTPTETTPPAVDLLAVPSYEECEAESIRYYEDLMAGRLTFAGIPFGHHIAYYDGRIVDHDEDPNVLIARAGAALKIHPARFSVHYPWPWP